MAAARAAGEHDINMWLLSFAFTTTTCMVAWLLAWLLICNDKSKMLQLLHYCSAEFATALIVAEITCKSKALPSCGQ